MHAKLHFIGYMYILCFDCVLFVFLDWSAIVSHSFQCIMKNWLVVSSLSKQQRLQDHVYLIVADLVVVWTVRSELMCFFCPAEHAHITVTSSLIKSWVIAVKMAKRQEAMNLLAISEDASIKAPFCLLALSLKSRQWPIHRYHSK